MKSLYVSMLSIFLGSMMWIMSGSVFLTLAMYCPIWYMSWTLYMYIFFTSLSFRFIPSQITDVVMYTPVSFSFSSLAIVSIISLCLLRAVSVYIFSIPCSSSFSFISLIVSMLFTNTKYLPVVVSISFNSFNRYSNPSLFLQVLIM